MLQSVANSYQDVYRAQWAWLILMAPERVPGMITSMLNDYREVSLAKETRSLQLTIDAGRLASNVEEHRR